jgi:hypothetical protein
VAEAFRPDVELAGIIRLKRLVRVVSFRVVRDIRLRQRSRFARRLDGNRVYRDFDFGNTLRVKASDAPQSR